MAELFSRVTRESQPSTTIEFILTQTTGKLDIADVIAEVNSYSGSQTKIETLEDVLEELTKRDTTWLWDTALEHELRIVES